MRGPHMWAYKEHIVHPSLTKIKEQNGSCDGLFCPECELKDPCFNLPPTRTVEELYQLRLKAIEEIAEDE